MKNFNKEESYEIVESTLKIKNSLSIIYDFCCYHEDNNYLISISSLIEMLKFECEKILEKF